MSKRCWLCQVLLIAHATLVELQSVGSLAAGAEVDVVGMEEYECKESFVLVVTCQRAAKSSAMSCELIRCSFSES